MDISAISKTSGYAISALDDALEYKPTGLARIMLAYAPRVVGDFLMKGRFRLQQLRHQEKALDEIADAMLNVRGKLRDSFVLPNENTPLLRLQLNQLEKEYRLLQVIRLALPYPNMDEILNETVVDNPLSESEAVWWDMFEDLASRRNESWRVNLFAESVRLNDRSPGSISLKALWEIAMMEEPDFSALSIFCDSSLYIDGKPVVLMEPDEQYEYEFRLNDLQISNLALCVSSLVEKNLVQRVGAQFMTRNPVELRHKSGVTQLNHSVLNIPEDAYTAIRIDGFSPTDHCLDICKLYRPKLNIASDRNLELIKEQLRQQMDQAEPGDYENHFEFVTSD